jgi:ribulose-phosphate 3-epimerase
MAHPGLKISPSMERCDWLNMEHEVHSLEEAGVDFLHLDIMDRTYGHSILLSPKIIPMLKEVTKIPLDIHMFVTEPEYFLPAIMEVCDPNDYITIQLEAVVRPAHTLALIRDNGLRAGIVTETGTPTAMIEPLLPYADMVNLIIRDPGIKIRDLNPQILKKIRETRRLMDENGMETADLSVDGSIRFEDVDILMEAGANMLVLGSKIVFRKGFTYQENCEELRKRLKLC